MEDKIYVKTKDDGIWEKNATLGFGLYLVIYIIIFFGSIFSLFFLNIPIFILTIWLIFITIFLIIKSFNANQSKNLSKSTAFIERNGKLYAIQLLYTKKDLGTETNRNIIYMPSGTLLQAATLGNNIKVAKNVQAHEKEVRERRNNCKSFSIGLDDILQYLEKHPNDYKVLPNSKRTKLDNLFMYNIENAGMPTIATENAEYKLLILNNPKVINENKKNFTISFYNEENELCNAKFSNCFDKIINNIKEKY